MTYVYVIEGSEDGIMGVFSSATKAIRGGTRDYEIHITDNEIKKLARKLRTSRCIHLENDSLNSITIWRELFN